MDVDERSKNVVDISMARVMRGDVEKERRKEKAKVKVFWVILLTLISAAIYLYDPDTTVPLLNVQRPISSLNDKDEITVTINQDEYGHYSFIGEINNKEVKFLLDTGATTVAVPKGVANYLGLHYGQTYYSNTANGKSLSYEAIAKEIRVGAITLINVESSISSGLEGDEILLGMSFLKNLSIIQEQGKIVLMQKGTHNK